MSQSIPADDRIVLVTGASSGIGRACAEHLGRKGYRVYGASRSTPDPALVDVHHISMDITDDSSVDEGVQVVLEREGRIDAVVHCAGGTLSGPFEDTSIEEAKAQFDLNYFGAVRVCKAVLPGMRARRNGRLLVVGSVGGLIGLRYRSHYSATKFALDGLVEAIRPELAPHGISVAVVHPGDFNTPISHRGQVSQATMPGTPYHDVFERAHTFYKDAEQKGSDPMRMAQRIETLLRVRSLPVRVVVGTPLEGLGVAAKKGLPSRWFEVVVSRVYGSGF